MTGTGASTAVFAGLLVLALVVEARARRGAGPVTAAEATAAAMRTTAGRLTVLVAWLWLGVHFLAR